MTGTMTPYRNMSVKTAKEIVPMMNASELLTLSMNGGLDP
jgi:hypothetical protein